jgi:hypothetical protein
MKEQKEIQNGIYFSSILFNPIYIDKILFFFCLIYLSLVLFFLTIRKDINTGERKKKKLK